MHVAVGVLKKQGGKVLISKRHIQAHQGSLWEFPGGKVEPGEDVQQALAREINEELNLSVLQARPLIAINHQYPDLEVYLDVWEVVEYSGDLRACEGQPIRWVDVDDLQHYAFPAANLPIISAVRLPRHYAILNGQELESLRQSFLDLVAKGLKLIQLRAKSLPENQARNFINFAKPICEQNHIQLLINSAMINAARITQDGLHLTSADLQALSARPEGFKRVGASCHTLEDLQRAEQYHLDFAVLGPVLATESHPGAEALGWARFSQMLEQVNIPVYALGGMTISDQKKSFYSGAQGIAGIRAFQ